jgi:hypothetical protein
MAAVTCLRQRPPSPPPRTSLRAAVVACLVVVAPSCGPKQAPLTARPAASSAALRSDRGPAPPEGGLGFPGLAVPWTPPSLTAGDPSALAAALAEVDGLTLLLGPRLTGEGWAQRGAGLVAALSPNTRVVGHRPAEMQALAAADLGEVQAPRRSLGPDGRPRYSLPAGAATWLKGQEGVALALDDAAVELDTWQALAAVSVGSCEPVMQALAEGQELALAQLGPFLDHADALLWAVYREQLRAFVPGFVAELAAQGELGPARTRADFADDAGFAKHECMRAYQAQLRRYVRCSEAKVQCAEAPRMVLLGAARIVAPEPGAPVGDHCPALVGRDYAAEIRRLGQAAAEAASEVLDREWTVLADRLGTVGEVYAALEDICTPRRRRFAEADLEQARARLVHIGAALASDEHEPGAGRWQIVDVPRVVPGLGPARELARFEAGSGSPNAEIVADARALREFVLSHSLCHAGHSPRPLAAAVGEGEKGLRFLGYFYEEELFCGALPPLLSAP